MAEGHVAHFTRSNTEFRLLVLRKCYCQPWLWLNTCRPPEVLWKRRSLWTRHIRHFIPQSLVTGAKTVRVVCGDLDMRLTSDEVIRGKSPPDVCPLTVHCSSVSVQREAGSSAVGLTVYSRWSCEWFQTKTLYLSVTTMHGRSESQLTRNNNISVIIEQLV